MSFATFVPRGLRSWSARAVDREGRTRPFPPPERWGTKAAKLTKDSDGFPKRPVFVSLVTLALKMLVVYSVLYQAERNYMPTKVNVVLDDDVKADLEQLVESGKRSRVINTALRRELLALRRERAALRLDALRRGTRPVSTETLVREVRRDRRR